MIKSGGYNVKHIKELAFMGFYEVLKNITTILRNISFCKNDIKEFNPDKIIYIDYPGFNLKICKWAKNNGYKNFFYISPQIWAWKENRIKTIKNNIDKLFVIFPFEKEYYREKHNMEVEFYGHPLIEKIGDFSSSKDFLKKNNITKERDIITLLPGSRSQEINSMLPIFLTLKKHYLNFEFIVAGVKNVNESVYQPALDLDVKVIYNQTYDLLSHSKIAIVTSGTASLECALFNVPQIVCYKTSSISYFIGKSFVNISFISLVNIILKKSIVKELVQNELTEKNLVNELSNILSDNKISDILNEYSKIYSMLSIEGTSKKIATSIIS
jgi:lipid-A-disaccharide synthase